MGRQVWSGKSDISWWMRLLSQRIAQKANLEDQIAGKFWQSRYGAVRLIDDEAIVACAAYVDLNPIRAGMKKTIEDSQFTSARLRLQTIADAVQDAVVQAKYRACQIHVMSDSDGKHYRTIAIVVPPNPLFPKCRPEAILNTAELFEVRVE